MRTSGRWIATAAVLIVLSAGVACAVCNCPRHKGANVGTRTSDAVTDTAKSAVSGTASIAEASATDTASAPKTAIQAVKDTANAALSGTDKAMKALTGEER